MSFFAIIDPEQRTNLVCNPSAETTGNYAPLGATVSISSDQARWGIRSWKAVMGGTSQGLSLAITTAANSTHYCSWYAFSVTGTMRATLDSGTNWNTAQVIGGKAGGSVRWGVAIPPAQSTGSGYIRIIDTSNDGTIYIDGVQVEPGTYPTTYIDGDLPGLYRWNGLRHASSSTRDAQERSGGNEEDLLDNFGILVEPSFSGVGMPPIKNNIQNLSIQPGALFQSYKVLPREIILVADINVNSVTTNATWITMHQRRQNLINLVKPDRARGAQPFTLVYKGADRGGGTRNLYAKFIYQSGLEFGNVQGILDTPQIRCLAVDPAWYEDNQQQQVLTMQQSLSVNYVAGRINGQWNSLTTGVTGAIYSILPDVKTNRIYMGGTMSTASSIYVGGFTYWDNGNNVFRALGGATKGMEMGGSNPIVYGLAPMPSGNIVTVGQYTTAGGAISKGIAIYNPTSDGFTTYNTTASSVLGWRGVAVDQDNRIYIAGPTTNWNGVSTESYVVSLYNGTWSTVGVQPMTGADTPTRNTLIIDTNNNLILGTDGLGSTNGSIRKWNKSTWSVLASANTAGSIYSLISARDGNILSGGFYNSLGGFSANNCSTYNGVNASALDGGVNGSVYAITQNSSALTAIGGDFTTAGSLSLIQSLILWNNYTFVNPDILLPNAAQCWAAAYNKNDLYIGFNQAGTAYASAINNVVTNATEGIYPRLVILGPTTAGTTAALVWLENQSTDERLYFQYIVQGGETVTLDLNTNRKTMNSDWRGNIPNQPMSGSDTAYFHLLPTTNTIALFMHGKVTSTSGTQAILQWIPAHWSVDGGA